MTSECRNLFSLALNHHILSLLLFGTHTWNSLFTQYLAMTSNSHFNHPFPSPQIIKNKNKQKQKRTLKLNLNHYTYPNNIQLWKHLQITIMFSTPVQYQQPKTEENKDTSSH